MKKTLVRVDITNLLKGLESEFYLIKLKTHFYRYQKSLLTV
jgi:hypothetical protein